jgi:hypothetical protein
MTLRSNPRILVIYALAPVLAALGVGAIFLLGTLFGLIVLALALFFAWSILKFLRRQLSTRLETLTEEVVFTMTDGDKVVYPWQQIRVAGIAVEQDDSGRPLTRKRRLFLYNEQDDKMIALTDEFENLDSLAAELRTRTDFREILLVPGETLKGKLREIVGQL